MGGPKGAATSIQVPQKQSNPGGSPRDFGSSFETPRRSVLVCERLVLGRP